MELWLRGQAGQSFLPPTIGRPRAKPESLAKRLLATSFVVGSANSLMSAVILFYAAGVFATSGDVLATVATLVPFVCAGLFIHCLSMSTEGIMLAGRKYTYLVWTYAANSVVVFLAFQAALAVGLSQLQAVWTGIITFQSVRLVTNFLTLGSPYSVLKSTQPLKGNM